MSNKKDPYTYSILEISYTYRKPGSTATYQGKLLVEPTSRCPKTSMKRWSVHFPWGTEVLSGSFETIRYVSGNKLHDYYANKDQKIPDELSTEKRSKWMHSTP